MPKLKNKKTGIVYNVTQKDLVKIMSSSVWAKVYVEVGKKPEPPKEIEQENDTVIKKDDVKQAKKASKRKKGDE